MGDSAVKDSRRYRRADLLCDVFSVICLIVMFLLTALYWSQLPQQIPTHYGISGQPDSWGGKNSIFILPALSLFLYILLTAVRFMPDRFFNYPVAVTEENRERLASLSREMLSVLKVCFLAAFLPILIWELKGEALPLWYIPLLLALIICPVTVYLVRMVRSK